VLGAGTPAAEASHAGAGPSPEGKILVFTCAAHALTHVYMVLFTPVSALMATDLGLEIGEVTGLATISSVLFGLGAIPSGWLGDRFGEKRLLVAFYWLTAAGGILIGLARGTVMLAAGMALLGIGASIFHPVGNSLIAKGIAKPGRAMGTNGLWGSIGQAIGPVLAAQVAAMASWRFAYIVLAPLMVILGTRLARSKLEVPSDGARLTLPRINGLLGLLLLAMTFAGFNYWLVITVLPRHIEAATQGGFLPDTVRGGYLTGLVYLIGGFGQYLAGHAVHHREGRGLYVLIFALQAPLVYLTGRFLGLPLIVTACAMSVLLFASQPIENVLLSRFSPVRGRSTLFGLKFTLAFGVGGLGTGLSGWVARAHAPPGQLEATGAVFTAAALFIAGALACALAALMQKAPPPGKSVTAPGE
jgi:MFS family permease